MQQCQAHCMSPLHANYMYTVMVVFARILFSRKSSLKTYLRSLKHDLHASVNGRAIPTIREGLIFAKLCIRNLAFAPRSTKEVAFKTLVRLYLSMQHPLGALTRNFRLIRLRKFRGQQPAGSARDGETRVVSAKCLMSLNGHHLRPGGTSPPCFSSSFTRFIVEQCLLKKTSI